MKLLYLLSPWVLSQKLYSRINEDINKYSYDTIAKNRYALLAFIVATPIQIAFSIYNLTEKKYLESILDLSSALLFFLSFFIFVKTDKQKITYRIQIFTLIAINIYSLYFDTDYLNALMLTFFILPQFIFRLTGLKEGFTWLIFLFVFIISSIFLNDYMFLPSLGFGYKIRYLPALFFLIIFSGAIEWLNTKNWIHLTKTKNNLLAALKEQKTLEGFIPICSYCKKIKTDEGYWESLTNYLKMNTSAQISRGLCPSCAEKQQKPVDNSLQSQSLLLDINKAITHHDISKKRLIVGLGILGISAILIFSAIEFYNKHFLIGIFQLFSALILSIALHFFNKQKYEAVIYNIMTFGLFTVVFEPLVINSHNPAEILWFFIFPIAVYYFLPSKQATIWMIIFFASTLLVLFNPQSIFNSQFSNIFIFYFILVFVVVSLMAFNGEKLRKYYTGIINLQLTELNTALENIKTIQGIVPVCASCNAIRDDKGYWSEVEAYMTNHSQILFSHSICKECLKKEFPDMYDEISDSTPPGTPVKYRNPITS